MQYEINSKMVFSLRAWGGPAGRPGPPRRGEVSHAVPPDGLGGGLGGGGQDAEAALPPVQRIGNYSIY